MPVPIPDETILGLIAANPQHGYQILDQFTSQDKLGWVWNMSTSQVYAVLNRLEKNLLINGNKVIQKDAPAKKEYSITPTGSERMHAWLYDPAPSSNIRWVRIDFSSKLYIAKLLNLPTIDIIEFQRTSLERHQKWVKDNYKDADNMMETMLSTFIQGQLQAAIKWLNDLPVDPH